ncbi:MAG: hypothetical protein DMF65_04015, partial [Acidobacteria bacterium]
LQQFAPEQDPNSMQVELWDADRSLALTLPEDSKPEPADLGAEFRQCAADPFKAAGAIRQVGDAVAYPVVAAVMDDAGKPVGCLVRWRRASLTPNARKQLSDILGSQATVYYGQGDVFTDLDKIVPRPPVSLSSNEVALYARDGDSFMALARPVSGTPWFVVVEFPEQVFLAQADRILRRIFVIDLILLLAGVAVAFAMSRSITRPLRSLTEAASVIRGGDYSRTVDIRRKDEMGALAAAFNAMVVKVRDSRRELERKVQERTLQLEAAPNAMLIVDERGRVTLANTQAERLFGYDRAELLEQPVENLIPERYRGAHPGLRAGFFGHPASRPMGAGRDLYGLRKDGREVPVEIGLNPVRIDESTFVLASVIDITERKRAEEALRESQARLAGIVDSAMDAIITADEDQRIVLFNHAAEKMFLYPSEDVNRLGIVSAADSRRRFRERAERARDASAHRESARHAGQEQDEVNHKDAPQESVGLSQKLPFGKFDYDEPWRAADRARHGHERVSVPRVTRDLGRTQTHRRLGHDFIQVGEDVPLAIVDGRLAAEYVGELFPGVGG